MEWPEPGLTLPLGAPPPPVEASAGLVRLPNGVGLWTWDTGGDGPAVVLAHPHSGNHASWAWQQPALAAAGYRVIGYSRRGYAGSERGPADDLGTQAGDLALLLDALGVERCSLIGSAAGGSTILDFVLANPDRCAAAVVASSLMSIQEPDYRAAQARARGGWFDGLPPEAKELGTSFRALDPDGVAAWRRIFDLNGFTAERPPVRQPLASNINWRTLDQNRTPMLLLTGGADLYLPPALLREVAPKVGAAEWTIAPEAGHPVFAEAPAAFNRVVIGFLASRLNA